MMSHSHLPESLDSSESKDPRPERIALAQAAIERACQGQRVQIELLQAELACIAESYGTEPTGLLAHNYYWTHHKLLDEAKIVLRRLDDRYKELAMCDDPAIELFAKIEERLGSEEQPNGLITDVLPGSELE